MNTPYDKQMGVNGYSKKYLIFVFFVALAVVVLSKVLPVVDSELIWWGVFAFFLVVSPVIHFTIMGSKEDNGQAFVRRFMLVTTLKFMFFLLIVVIVFLGWKAYAKNFIVVFLLHYLLFTAFETYMLYSSMKMLKR